MLIGWFLSSIRGQTDKIWKFGLACTVLCKWATCTCQTCLSKILFIPGIWSVLGLYYKKQIVISFLCVSPLIEDKFHHNIVKVLNLSSKLGLAHGALCKWAICMCQTCLSKTLFIPGIWPVSGLVIVKNKLTSVFYASVLFLKINFIITLSKFAVELLACSSWFHSHFDNVMTQFIINKRTVAY